MSHQLYATRLFWTSGRRGVAKLHGHAVPLAAAPSICGAAVDGVDYTPEVGVYRIQRRHEGWRDMERAEIADADLLLHRLATVPQASTPIPPTAADGAVHATDH